MELIYLWVEDYKNIKKQGFNFSPNFDVKFTPIYENEKLSDKSKLTVTPKDNSLKDFFGKDISVTAIVGENGSGKSSILEFLAEIFRIEHNKNRNLIVDNDHNNNNNFSLAFKIKDKTYKIQSIDHHDSNTFNDDEKIENILDYYIYSNDKKIENQFLLDNASIAQMIVYDYSKNKNFQLSSFMYLPTKIEIKLCDFERKFEKLITNDKLYPLSKHERDVIYIQNTSTEQQTQISNFQGINNDKYLQFLILKLLENSEATHDFYLTKEKIHKKLTTQKIEFVSKVDFDKYFKISEGLGKKLVKEVSALEKQEKEIYINKYSDFFEFDFIDNVIFLEKGKQVYPNIETFGANIHTLLSHGFFMKDGLMGEFARGKITVIKDFYEKVKTSKNSKIEDEKEFEDNIKNFRHIQNIIGEPFLKTIVENYLDELEQIFDTEEYKTNKKNELLKQFSKEELQAYLDQVK